MRSRSPRSSIRRPPFFARFSATEVVLEHHSSIDEARIEGREARDKLRLAMEDWAAPVVVTTNVQLFESLHFEPPVALPAAA